MPSSSVVLRDYQLDILRRISAAWSSSRSVMVQMPTGTGKTHVLASVVKSECEDTDAPGRPVWIVAHRRELVCQIRDTLQRHGIQAAGAAGCFTPPDMPDADYAHSGLCRVRVLSVQWLSRHMAEQREHPSLIVIDEAHHALAATYRELWHRYPEARKLGFTATPCRMNHSGFTGLFDVLVTSWSIAEFIRKGRLSPFDYISIRTGSREQMLLDSLKKRGADGDYQIKEMAGLFNRKPNIVRLYHSVRKFADGKKGIVYAIDIEHARSIAAYYDGKGIASAAIDSRTPAAERKRLVDSFKTGGLQVLVNVDVFSEGFDCPDVGFVQMARPTLSLSKYLQQVGRGLRVTAGKDSCVLIDNVGLYRLFGLPTVDWDWESMFRGRQAGKASAVRACGSGVACASAFTPAEAVVTHSCAQASSEVQDTSVSDDMHVVVSSDRLLAMIGGRDSASLLAPPAVVGRVGRGDTCLRAFRDAVSGLWGLRLGGATVAAAQYAEVFGVRGDMAAVRWRDGRCGVVDAAGTAAWQTKGCRRLKFLRNHMLEVLRHDGRQCYVDLYSFRQYDAKPEIVRYGMTELLRVGRRYYSRTRRVYVNRRDLGSDYIDRRRFYLAIYDSGVPRECSIDCSAGDAAGGLWSGHDECCGYVCLLDGDHDSFYWIYSWLPDGSIVVMDAGGSLYHASEGREKRRIEAGEPSR